jgi:hypothetical protein
MTVDPNETVDGMKRSSFCRMCNMSLVVMVESSLKDGMGFDIGATYVHCIS